MKLAIFLPRLGRDLSLRPHSCGRASGAEPESGMTSATGHMVCIPQVTRMSPDERAGFRITAKVEMPQASSHESPQPRPPRGAYPEVKSPDISGEYTEETRPLPPSSVRGVSSRAAAAASMRPAATRPLPALPPPAACGPGRGSAGSDALTGSAGGREGAGRAAVAPPTAWPSGRFESCSERMLRDGRASGGCSSGAAHSTKGLAGRDGPGPRTSGAGATGRSESERTLCDNPSLRHRRFVLGLRSSC